MAAIVLFAAPSIESNRSYIRPPLPPSKIFSRGLSLPHV